MTTSPPLPDATASVEQPTRTRPPSRRQDAVLLACVSVLVVGLFSDGWAHANIVDELEGFITPWHGIVFLGFLLTAGWILLQVNDRRVPGRPLRAAVPPGWDGAVLAVGAFFIGFNGDALWHTVFGLESDIDALLSPTHLLMAGALLTVASTPFRTRAAAADGRWGRDGLRVASLLLTMLVVAFFLLYLWTPSFGLGSAGYAAALASAEAPPFLSEVSQIAVLASTYVVTVVVLLPVLLLARAERTPPGAVALLALLPAVAVTGVREFDNAQSLLAFAAAALTAEAVVRTTAAGRWRLLVLGAAVPTVLWSVHWVVLAAVLGLGWEVELYTGQAVTAAAIGVGVAHLVDRAQASSPVRTSR